MITVLDANAIIWKLSGGNPSEQEIVTTSYIINEIKDAASKQALELHAVTVREAATHSDELAVSVIRDLGLSTRVSREDQSLLALCLEIEEVKTVNTSLEEYVENQQIEYIVYDKSNRRRKRNASSVKCCLMTYDKDLQKCAYKCGIKVVDLDGREIIFNHEINRATACLACKSVYVKYTRQFCKMCGNSGLRIIPLTLRDGKFAIPKQYFKHPPKIPSSDFSSLGPDAAKHFWIREDQHLGDRMRKHLAQSRKYEKMMHILSENTNAFSDGLFDENIQKPKLPVDLGQLNPNDIQDRRRIQALMSK